jgi:RNA polymerase-binding transcription factor DksA
MDREALERFRGELFKLGREMKGSASDLREEALRKVGGEASGSLSNLPMHLADLGSDVYEEGIALSLLENTDQRLEEIGAALDRLDNGTYGRCDVCQREIPMERLEAIPYAGQCIDCARRTQAGAPSMG